jgi:nitrite reductase (cytochrome c-552)
MKTTRLIRQLAIAAAMTLCTLGNYALAYSASEEKAAPIKPVDTKKCYACHDNIEEFHANGKHAKVNCANCHEGTDKHLADKKVKPVTRTDHKACGVCHQDEFNSYVQINLNSKARIEKGLPKGRSPLFDKLLAGHGFTKEHAEPRSHAFMLTDHFVVDRAYGGRWQWKSWYMQTDNKSAVEDSWTNLVDKDPASDEQKVFMPQAVTAANPVCLNCKTQDHILKWKYMGDPDPNAKWDRTSKVVAFARDLHHPLNCYSCHDPHSAGPRVVRDALIQAVVDRGEGTYPYDKEKSKQTTMTKVMFQRDGKDFRAIGLLSKPDSNVMCAQCHVEYNCNPGYDTTKDNSSGKYTVTMADQRTNFFPWVNVLDYKAKMETVHFRDFKHAATGALIGKLQHPETETFWNSKHERAGLECKHCHMPQVKNAKGKVYTSHWQKSPRYMLKDTCLKCHGAWSEEEAVYQIDSIQNYTRGRMYKAEYWLAQLIDTIVKAKGNVDDATLKQAQELQNEAHGLWEWWTAENSDGFHNPQLARESLGRSMDASQKGIKLLKDAMSPAPAAALAPAAAPAPAH